MNLSFPRSTRLAAIALATATTGVAMGLSTATPVAAQGGAYYTATLANAADENRAVAGGVAWVCQGTTCVANKGSSRPSRVCRGLAREFGEITAFTANGEALDEKDLARCNGN